MTTRFTVFDDIESMNSYNHHDYFLTNLPLCLEWLDFSDGSAAIWLARARARSRPTTGRDGSFAAVGSLDCQGIDVWDLDVVNSIEPVIVGVSAFAAKLFLTRVRDSTAVCARRQQEDAKAVDHLARLERGQTVRRRPPLTACLH